MATIAVHADPKNRFANSLLGDIAQSEGNLDEALHEYQHELETGRKRTHTSMQAHALIKLANLMTRTKKKDLVNEYLQLAHNLEPNN